MKKLFNKDYVIGAIVGVIITLVTNSFMATPTTDFKNVNVTIINKGKVISQTISAYKLEEETITLIPYSGGPVVVLEEITAKKFYDLQKKAVENQNKTPKINE